MADSRPLFTIGTFAIIFNEESLVLLSHRRDMDAWNLPGGGLEPGELPNEGVCREVLEETGLIVEVERLVGVYGKRGRNELVFAFVCRVTGGKLMPTNEADENGYFSIDQLPSNTLLKHAERIWDALRKDQQPVFRIQGRVRDGG
jgi:8-oxo-dGTP diphosphatase